MWEEADAHESFRAIRDLRVVDLFDVWAASKGKRVDHASNPDNTSTHDPTHATTSDSLSHISMLML